MKFDQNPKTRQAGSQKRKLKTKPLLLVIAILFAFNVFWFIGWLLPDKKPKQIGEEVASVAGDPIMREQWMTEMEKEVGRETLLELVNSKVMETAAKQYEIEVTDKEIDLEVALIHSVDGRSYTGLDMEQMRKRIRSSLILEKVLTKDVVVKENEIEKHYEENASLYNIPTAYRTAIIVVPTKEEAEQTVEELSKGSNFEVLAKERSTDLASASLGGDIGYINSSTDAIDKKIVETVVDMKTDSSSGVIALNDGTYTVIQVREIIKGQSFTLSDVSDHIRREIALEQLPQSVNPEAFWDEFDAKWFYGK